MSGIESVLIGGLLVFAGTIAGQLLTNWNAARLQRNEWQARRHAAQADRRDEELRGVQDAFNGMVEARARARDSLRDIAGVTAVIAVDTMKYLTQIRTLLARVGDYRLRELWLAWNAAEGEVMKLSAGGTSFLDELRSDEKLKLDAIDQTFHERVGELLRE